LCTRSDEISCKAILEFGKRGDMASALSVFEASKDNMGYVNLSMAVYWGDYSAEQAFAYLLYRRLDLSTYWLKHA
ncbi:hypothetical protein Tco_0026761, partial [Tanacetum coccineum]